MYSVVLMTALATGGDSASFGWRSGCVGNSCGGVVVGGCSGYAVSSGCCGGYVAPSGCCGGYVESSGCCGGRSLFPLFPNLRSRVSSLFSRGCGGCTGYPVSSCHGSSCYGSSCYGSSCYGSSCYGSSCYGSSCQGSTTYYAPVYGHGAGGCYGTGPVAPSYYGANTGTPYIVESQVGVPVSRRSDAREYRVASATPTAAAPARLTVELPADAMLFVDGQKVAGKGSVRNFHTPDLPEGTFFYDLKAEVTVDGETVAETVRVLVKAGDTKTESFGKLIAAVKAAKNPVVVSK